MSAGAPYVAPWQTGFTKYAVQLYKLPLVAADLLRITVAEGQWWRIIYVTAEFVAGGTTNTVVVELQIDPSLAGQQVYLQAATDNQPQNSTFNYVWGPTITAYKSTGIPAKAICVQTIPDVLWQYGTTIGVEANGYVSGDSWGVNTNGIAVEIYTEDYETGALVPSPVATPILA